VRNFYWGGPSPKRTAQAQPTAVGVAAHPALFVIASFFLMSACSGGTPRPSDNLEPNQGEAELRRSYAQAIADADRSADAWRARNGGGTVFAVDGPSDDEKLVAANHGCPQGTQFWRRGPNAELCASVCATDADCGAQQGRCRVLDGEDRSKAPSIVLADELSAEQPPTAARTLAGRARGGGASLRPVLRCCGRVRGPGRVRSIAFVIQRGDLVGARPRLPSKRSS
jgi:hypothetical protein